MFSNIIKTVLMWMPRLLENVVANTSFWLRKRVFFCCFFVVRQNFTIKAQYMQFRQISNSSFSCLNLLGLGSNHVLGNSYFDYHACLHICVWCTHVSICILVPCVPLYLFQPSCIYSGDMRTLRKQFIFPVLCRKDPTNTYSLSSSSSRLSCSAVDFVSSSSCLTSLSLCSSFCWTASNSSRASFSSSLMTFFSEAISS